MIVIQSNKHEEQIEHHLSIIVQYAKLPYR